jgi:hypothetical protein
VQQDAARRSKQEMLAEDKRKEAEAGRRREEMRREAGLPTASGGR